MIDKKEMLMYAINGINLKQESLSKEINDGHEYLKNALIEGNKNAIYMENAITTNQRAYNYLVIKNKEYRQALEDMII